MKRSFVGVASLVALALLAAGCDFTSGICGDCQLDKVLPVRGAKYITISDKLDLKPMTKLLAEAGKNIGQAEPVVRVDILDEMEVDCAQMVFGMSAKSADGKEMLFKQPFFFPAVLTKEQFEFRLPPERLAGLQAFLNDADSKTIKWGLVFGYSRLRVADRAPEAFLKPLSLKVAVRFEGVAGEVAYPDAALSGGQKFLYALWDVFNDLPSLREYLLDSFSGVIQMYPKKLFLDGDVKLQKALKRQAEAVDSLIGKKKYGEALTALHAMMTRFDGGNGGDPSDDWLVDHYFVLYLCADEIAASLEPLARAEKPKTGGKPAL